MDFFFLLLLTAGKRPSKWAVGPFCLRWLEGVVRAGGGLSSNDLVRYVLPPRSNESFGLGLLQTERSGVIGVHKKVYLYEIKCPFSYQMLQLEGSGDKWGYRVMCNMREGHGGIKVNEIEGPYFPTLKQLRQGGSLSPQLFDLADLHFDEHGDVPWPTCYKGSALSFCEGLLNRFTMLLQLWCFCGSCLWGCSFFLSPAVLQRRRWSATSGDDDGCKGLLG